MVVGVCWFASLRDWSAQLGSLVFLSQTLKLSHLTADMMYMLLFSG